VSEGSATSTEDHVAELVSDSESDSSTDTGDERLRKLMGSKSKDY
jgi:hypothetical protein